MTSYWECTQCKDWHQGDSPPGQCSNCTNPDFDAVPEITESETWSPGWDLEGFKAVMGVVLFLNLASIPLAPLLNEELGGLGDIVALGGIVSTFLVAGLIYAANTKSYEGWVAAVAVFVVNLVGVLVMALAPALLMDVEVLGQPVLILIRNFGGLTFVEIFLLGTNQLAGTVMWLALTIVPLSMLANGRDQLILE